EARRSWWPYTDSSRTRRARSRPGGTPRTASGRRRESTSRRGAGWSRSSRSFQQALGFVGGRAVAVALTEPDRGLEVLAAAVAIAGLQAELAELEVGAAVNPFARFAGERGIEVGPRVGGV